MIDLLLTRSSDPVGFQVFVGIVTALLFWFIVSMFGRKRNSSPNQEGNTNLKAESNNTEISKDYASETYSFVDFVREHGPNIKKEGHMHHGNGSIFYTLEVSNRDGKTTSVRFHSSLGVLTSEQLRERKEELFVSKIKNDHRWYLHDNKLKTFKEWEDVDLGL